MNVQSDTSRGLQARNLHLDKRLDLDSFELAEGECLVLCGPNGSGKSTLLRLLCGLEKPDKGEISIRGTDINQQSRAEIAAQIAWLPQRPRLSEAMSCESIVAAARFRFGESSSRALRRARQVMVEHDLEHLIGKLSSQISGGELQRVLITTLIAQEAPFLLVDEPANHLDPAYQVATYRRLGSLWQSGKTLVIVTHDVRLAQVLGPREKIRVAAMKEGRLVCPTTLADPALPEVLTEIYGVPFVSLDQAGSLSIDLLSIQEPR